MKKKENLFYHSACIFLLLFTLIILRPDIAACAVPTLDWSGEEGLWNDGVHPDYGIKSGAGADTFTFQVSYQDADNDPPDTGYPQVHIKRIISNELQDIAGSPFTLNAVDGDDDYTDGKLYYLETTLSPAGNDYKYSFVAYDDTYEEAYGSPANDHTLTVVDDYVWVDYDDGTDPVSPDTCGKATSTYPICKTIAKGISMASAGEAVRVRPVDDSPFEYVESFSMVSGVHLVSDNSSSGDTETTYDDPYSDYETSMLTRTGRTTIKGEITFPGTITEDVVVDGFTVYLGATGVPTTLDIEGGSPIIRNNIVYRENAGGSTCIQMEGSSVDEKPIIENNLLHSVGNRAIGISTYMSPLIQDNEIWDVATYPGIGINRKGTEGGEITIRNNHIFNCGGPGIGSTNLVKGLKMIIQGNSIHNNGFDTSVSGKPLGAGINLARSGPGPNGTTLEIIIGGSEPGQENQIYDNTLAGISLDGNNASFNPVLIQNNDIYNNGKAGIVLIDAGYYNADPETQELIDADILDNTIHGQTSAAGILIGGATYADITYNAIYDNYAGIAFNMGDLEEDPDPPSSGPVNIEENDIYSNTMAGIAVRDAITNDVTIAGNDIYQNDRGGIGIINSCENLVINRNEIHNNVRVGIHTGTDVADDYFFDPEYPDYEGFIGEPDTALLTVTQNKVHNNGLNSYGGGIDIRHASGTILNNLIYENRKGGIRFGDYIDEIVNNTVVDNGHVVSDTEKYGGGIIYDNLDGNVNDQASGDGPSIPIRNNIIAFHPSAGIRTEEFVWGSACSSDDYRDYNLLYGNNGTPIDENPISWHPWKRKPQLGGCDPNDYEIFADPEFVDRDNDDYRIQYSDPDYSPAADAGDTTYGTDVSVPPGVNTSTIDMGAYGGPYGIDW